MSVLEDFLSKDEEKQVVQAIIEAELNTSVEIRVHIEAHSNTENHLDRVAVVFNSLKMADTKLRNGVLVYVAVSDHFFHIYGDEGINNLVSDNFWSKTRDIIQNRFKDKQFKEGLVEGILHIGVVLKGHFLQHNPSDDVNELSNEISRG